MRLPGELAESRKKGVFEYQSRMYKLISFILRHQAFSIFWCGNSTPREEEMVYYKCECISLFNFAPQDAKSFVFAGVAVFLKKEVFNTKFECIN